MIGNVSPNLGSSEDTLNTLRYSDRVKELKKEGSRNNEQKPMDLEIRDDESEENFEELEESDIVDEFQNENYVL
jgi:hypothetical protein